MKQPNPAAVALGKRSAAVRFKGKTKKERSEMMSKVRAKMKYFKENEPQVLKAGN